MSAEPEFKAFDKIPRLRRNVIVTEKIDGTNAIVHISEDGIVRAGSRSRWITPEDDNYGFAAWVRDNADELRRLGPGYHYGEWWGQGIQRRYNIEGKRFSLFNAGRWADELVRPKCCHVVPVLMTGSQDLVVDVALARLRNEGSVAAPGFMSPEGIVVYHTASRSLFKVTLERDEEPKGRAA
jgi:hypothetical protein